MAQQQKTQALDDEALGLPKLTSKQMAFVEGIRQGKSASQAYRDAYDVSGMTNPTIWAEASKVKNTPTVSPWLSYVQRETITAANYTHEAFLAELEELRLLSVQSGNMGAAVNATVNKGKSAGHMTEKQEITISTDKTDLEQAMDMLRQAGMDVAIPELTKH